MLRSIIQAGSFLGAILTSAPGCTSQSDAGAATMIERAEVPATVLNASEVTAWRAGTAREIELRTEAEHSGRFTPEQMVDSLVAEAAGLAPARYREIARTVEGLLARGPGHRIDPRYQMTADAESLLGRHRLALDSLRLEVVVLRARAGS